MTNACKPTDRRFPPDDAGDESGFDPTAGLPIGSHDPLTPMGEIEQFGRVAAGLSRQAGWRSAAARLAAAVLLLGVVAAIVFGVIQAIG